METPSGRISTEIAHVLFMDLVGYSLRTMEEQARLSHELRLLVRPMPEFQRAEARHELIALDTGDGMALVFFVDPIAPVQCALELARALQAHPDLKLRMGIHSGPVSRVIDIQGRENVTGGGINIAQRVMDCGDTGHILLSHSSAEVLAQFETWAASLHELGSCEVKHGTRLSLYNLFNDEIGNPVLPSRMKAASPASRDIVSPAQSDTSPASASPAADGVVTLDKHRAQPDETLPAGAFTPEHEQSVATGGALRLESKFYIVRATDEQFTQSVVRQDSIVLVKGARQMGKTSLLARGLQAARKHGARVVLTDFQTLNAAHLESLDTLFLTLAEMIADQLDLDISPAETWSASRGANLNLERFLRREVLSRSQEPVVWGLDEVDRLFEYPYNSEVFGLFRSWHNRRSLDPSGPLSQLTLALSYATEAHLFITDLNQSPFNVGTRLTLADFSLEQTAELNLRYGSPLRSPAEVARFYHHVGGQPYLTQRGLSEMLAQHMDIAAFEAQADTDEGMYGEHLRRILVTLTRDAEMTAVTRQVLAGVPCSSSTGFYRLRSGGVMAGETLQGIRLRCELYKTYLERHL